MRSRFFKAMKQETLVLIKPDAMNRHLVGEILSRFEAGNLDFVDVKMIQVTRELAETHYQFDNEDYLRSIGQKSADAGDQIDDLVAQGRKVINAMCEFLTSRPILAMILEGEEAIPAVRKIVGFTDPSRADKGTIRGDYGEDNILEANKEGRPVYNLVHASGNPEEAVSEIKLWFGDRK